MSMSTPTLSLAWLAMIVAAVAVGSSQILRAGDDPHHSHDPHERVIRAEPAREAPTLEHRLVLGNDLHRYESVPDWCRLPDERPLGNTHGTIVIDNAGHVYFNTDTKRSIMVYQPDGSFMRSFADDMPGVHGMVLRTEDGEQFIYAAHLKGKQIVKMRLDGSVLWTLGVPIESGKYDDNPGAFNPTAVAVAPNGDLFVADGYGRNWVHQYSADRTYIRSIGGPGAEPGKFRTCHGLAIDTRGDEPVLLVCDRENRRLQRFDLDGRFIDVPVTDLRRPCSVSIWKDYLAVAELEGRVTILNAEFEIEAHLGDNPDQNQWANNGVPPEVWRDGIFTAPHGCCFDDAGNLYVMDWNASGRVSKLVRVDDDEASGDRLPSP